MKNNKDQIKIADDPKIAAVTAAMTQLKADLAPPTPPAAPPPTVPSLSLTPDGVRERVTRAAARADAT